MKTKKWLCRNVHYQVERSTGFSPQPLTLPSDAIPPEQVLQHHRYLSAGAVWEDRHGSFRPHSSALYFIAKGKGILPSQKRRD